MLTNSLWLICDNAPPADPPISTRQTTHGHQNRLVVFLISGQGYFTFLYQHTKYTTEWMEEKNKQSRAWVSSKHKRGEVCDTFVQLSVHLQAIAGVYLRKTPTKPQGMLTHLLTLVNPAYVGQQVLATVSLVSSLSDSHRLTDILLTTLSCRLPSSAPFCWLSPSLFSGTFLPSFYSGLVGGLVHKPPVCVSR